MTEHVNLLKDSERRLLHLSLDRLRVANDFLAYLEDREELEATQELLSLTGFEESFKEAIEQVQKGQVVPFESIKRDV